MKSADQSKKALKQYKSLKNECQKFLKIREYEECETSSELDIEGVEAQCLLNGKQNFSNWIPGVEVFPRDVQNQRYRGHFGELVRKEEGVCEKIGLWPSQWSASTMFAGSSKGFHIHPPYIPSDEEVSDWFQKLYRGDKANYELRPYDKEQWDLMFFLTGSVELFLVDERQGLERNIMRVFIEGDDLPSPNNVGIVIPPGVAHAIRCDASRPAILVYGTSTVFEPLNEGRLANKIEKTFLPQEWSDYLNLKENDQ